MGLSKIKLEKILQELSSSVNEVFESVLNKSCVLLKEEPEKGRPIYGSLLELSSANSLDVNRRLYVFLVSDLVGCQELANDYLCTQFGEELDEFEFPEVDYADALGELLNMMAGRVCKNLEAFDPEIEIGMPAFIDEHLLGIQSSEMMSVFLQGGEHKIEIGVLSSNTN